MMLTANQYDALRELGNIGAAHAATTLSQMLLSGIDMTVPEIQLLDIANIYQHVGDETSALIVFQIQGEVSNGGYILLHLPRASAIRLVNILLGNTDISAGAEMDTSAIIEIGNIMVSAFLDATAGLLNLVMLPSPPSFALDMPHAAIETILAQQNEDLNEVVLFRTELRSQDALITANLLLLPNPPMLRQILELLERLVGPT
ncbi:MAG: chemotaxis protein CheC [Methanomicrobiales archaeon]|nr:chemotaxis protein CheC [Methanomicrobiales archaeon]